jgi:hypothetical protein
MITCRQRQEFLSGIPSDVFPLYRAAGQISLLNRNRSGGLKDSRCCGTIQLSNTPGAANKGPITTYMGSTPQSLRPFAGGRTGGSTFESILEVAKVFAGGLAIGNRWFKCNFHLHARGMDPVKLVDEAVRQGLDFIAVTDHQTVNYADPVIKAAAGRIVAVPGIEITAHEGVHLLAIFPPAYSADNQTKFLGFLEVSGSGEANQASRPNGS